MIVSKIKLKDYNHRSANLMKIVEEKNGKERTVGYIEKRLANRVKLIKERRY